MNQINLGVSDGKTISFDLDVLLATRLLIQASSGAGKSWAIRRIIEQAFSMVQIIVIDPEGEFSTLREKFDFILAGKGGDVPTDVRSAELLAHKVLELKASIICDISEMKPFERHAWVRGFLEGLIESPKALWHPLLVIVDEAHVYAPEKGSGESQAAEAMISLASRGRKRGFCAVFATQRLSKLRKDAAAELTNVMVGRTFQDVDRKRASDVLGVLRGDERKFFDELMVLKNGQFFALGRAVSMSRVLVNVGTVQTKHKSGTDFSTSTEPPPPTEKIRAVLAQLAELPKEAEKKAKTIADLETEARSLRGQLAASERKVQDLEFTASDLSYQVEKKRDYYRQRGYQDGYQVGFKDASVQLKQHIAAYTLPMPEVVKNPVTDPDEPEFIQEFPLLSEVPKEVFEYRDYLQESFELISDASPQPGPVFKPRSLGVTDLGTPPTGSTCAMPERNGDKLRAGAERMLAALCQWHPAAMPEGQMRSHAGMKKSGTFSTYMSDLRKGGYIESTSEGWIATRAGLAYFGNNGVPRAPATTEEVLAIWEPKLRDGARRILRVLVRHRGQAISHERLTAEANLSKSGTYSTYLSDLRRAQLIESKNGEVRANKETLFL